MSNPHEHAPARDALAGLIQRSAGDTEVLKAKGSYRVECRGADGEVKWVEDIQNLVVTVGKNYLLDTFLSGSSYTAAFYLGLVDGASAPSFAAADTMASHGGWSENVAYSNGTRPAISFNAASGGAKVSVAVVFNINGAATIAGCFLTTVSTKSGTTGTLTSAGSFSAGSRALQSGDTLSVTYQLSV